LKKKGFKEDRGTTSELDDLGTTTTLESNKSHVEKTTGFDCVMTTPPHRSGGGP